MRDKQKKTKKRDRKTKKEIDLSLSLNNFDFRVESVEQSFKCRYAWRNIAALNSANIGVVHARTF